MKKSFIILRPGSELLAQICLSEFLGKSWSITTLLYSFLMFNIVKNSI